MNARRRTPDQIRAARKLAEAVPGYRVKPTLKTGRMSLVGHRLGGSVTSFGRPIDNLSRAT